MLGSFPLKIFSQLMLIFLCLLSGARPSCAARCRCSVARCLRRCRRLLQLSRFSLRLLVQFEWVCSSKSSASTSSCSRIWLQQMLICGSAPLHGQLCPITATPNRSPLLHRLTLLMAYTFAQLPGGQYPWLGQQPYALQRLPER